MFRMVSYDEFFAVIGPMNCHPRIINSRYPYTSEFRTPTGAVVGKIVGLADGGSEYWLPSAKR